MNAASSAATIVDIPPIVDPIIMESGSVIIYIKRIKELL
jgi:hypothetical protein